MWIYPFYVQKDPFFVCTVDSLGSPCFEVYKDYPCLCLCFGLEQIIRIRPRLCISRHFSQILRTEALIFIFAIP